MKILLAEDDQDIQHLVVVSLQRGRGWNVLLATDGEECLAQAQREQPSVILMDVMMPKMDGFETCQRLKADAATKDIPIIFLSASAQEREMQRGLALGAIGYLYKPFDPLKLPQQVLELLHRARRVSPSSE